MPARDTRPSPQPPSDAEFKASLQRMARMLSVLAHEYRAVHEFAFSKGSGGEAGETGKTDISYSTPTEDTALFSPKAKAYARSGLVYAESQVNEAFRALNSARYDLHKIIPEGLNVPHDKTHAVVSKDELAESRAKLQERRGRGEL